MKYWLFIFVLLSITPLSMSSEIALSPSNRYLLWHSTNPDFSARFERTWKQETVACKDRDLLIVRIEGDPDRETYKISQDATMILLIGKDGGVKARWSQEVKPAEVYALIDAMPMRRQEIQERKKP